MRSIQLKYETPEAYAEYLKGIGITSVDCVHLDSALFCTGAPEMYLGALGHFAEEAIAFTSGRDFYYEDKTNMAYYQDWDRILRKITENS
jgi:hypothetical protein